MNTTDTGECFPFFADSHLQASPDGCLKAGTGWTAGRALNWSQWPQSGPIRDKSSPGSGSDGAVVRRERPVLTKQTTGVKSPGWGGSLPGNLSRTPWANTVNARTTLFSRPSAQMEGNIPLLVPCSVEELFVNVSPACIPHAQLSRINCDKAQPFFFLHAFYNFFPCSQSCTLGASHPISQTMYATGYFLAHMAGFVVWLCTAAYQKNYDCLCC